MGLHFFLLIEKAYWSGHNELFTHGKTFYRITAVDRDRITSRSSYDNKIFFATLFWCSLKRSPVILTKLLVIYLNTPRKSFNVIKLTVRIRTTCFSYRLWHSESSCAVTLLLRVDWMMLKNTSNQRGANSATICSLVHGNHGCGCWSFRKLPFSKIIWWLALGFYMDLQLNTTRLIHPWFLFTTCSVNSQRKPTKSLKFAI